MSKEFDLFTTAKTFPSTFNGTNRMFTMNIPSGQVLVEVLHSGTTWIALQTITVTGLYSIAFPNSPIRITPSGGAEVSLK